MIGSLESADWRGRLEEQRIRGRHVSGKALLKELKRGL